MLVELVDDNPEVRDDILDTCPDLTLEVLARFESIGRGTLHPRLLLGGTAGLKKLAKMPFSEQERYLNSPVEVMTASGDTLKVKVEHLTAAQTKQVFTIDGHRELSAQKNWIEAQGKGAKVASSDYQVSGNKVTFFADTVLDRKKIADILAQLV